MSPADLFMYCIAGAAGIALGLTLLGVVLGAVYIIGSALLRRFVR